MHVMQFSTKFRKVGISPITLERNDSTADAFPEILKILEKLIRRICGEVSFQYSYR